MLKELKQEERKLKDELVTAPSLHELENTAIELENFTSYVNSIGLVFSLVYDQTDSTGRQIHLFKPMTDEEVKELPSILKGEEIEYFTAEYYLWDKLDKSGLFEETTGVYKCL